ncbi:helix-turn-helix transcriptional regulator [Streptomyces sp. LP11]|uniref:Helix-turn-helix transcriptional regulator n=1 Tax=Streptomyces pyxinicus TaxID=2970331 RepID=A0ABT2B7M4_9ACTN|nr:helix-turn-helix transcriptional regulator [Streptomyces sp. LP11]MCS0604522.1 helix-turn-helix transcriptional regulator [Streptomyces sp. LP11]
MLEQSNDFGSELRRRRLAARLSLQQLGQRVHYSKSQLSKVERGIQRPTPELARLCDTELDAEGSLSRLVALPQAQPRLSVSGNDEEEVWLMQLHKDGSSSFQPVTRRDLIAAGAAAALSLQVGSPQPSCPTPEGAATLVDASRLVFEQLRRLGQASGPAFVLPPLIAQTHSLEQLAAGSGPRIREALLVLASRYAEYTGWMAQESGDDTAALWWTDRAVRLAAAGTDNALAVYAQVRRSLVSLYRGDVADSMELAAHALESEAPARIRGLAAQHLAQGRAVAGDYTGCLRSLDQARELLERDGTDPSQPVLGASHVPDVVSMFTGWCLYDLGRPRQAAEILDRELIRVPGHALRSRTRYGVRRALSHASAGDIDQACRLTSELLPSLRLISSATVSADVRRLSRTLGRHSRSSVVRQLLPELTASATHTHLS